MRKNLIFIFAFAFLISLTYVSANFACGVVQSAQNQSSAWTPVSVYYSENPSEVLSCKTNPEGKFCCDLEEINSVTWQVGKEVNAEVFDNETGYVAGPVKTTITGEGYDLFPEMTLTKPILINSEVPELVLNKYSVFFNISLSKSYPNLKYISNSSSGLHEEILCENCSSKDFNLTLDKGKNEIDLIAYGKREFKFPVKIYNLDFLNIETSLSCEGCSEHGGKFYVSPGKNVSVKINVNGSHKFSGELKSFFPENWGYDENLPVIDYSDSHKEITFDALNDSKSYTFEYLLKSPDSFWPKKINFISKMSESENKIDVLLMNPRSWFGFLAIPHRFSRNPYGHIISQQTSENEPVIWDEGSYSLDTIAIYPNKKINHAYIKIISKKSFFSRRENFRILSNIPENSIERTYIKIKIRKGKEANLYVDDRKVKTSFLESKGIYDYYEYTAKKVKSLSVKIR